MISSSHVRHIFQCEHCEHSFKTAKGLKIHTGKSHKALKPPISPEKVREDPHENSLTVSPVRDTRREEEKVEQLEEDTILLEYETPLEHLGLNDETEKNNLHIASKLVPSLAL